jgi:DNA polymerase-4
LCGAAWGCPGSKRGIARLAADRAVDRIRDRFGWRSVPDEFRALAEHDL